MRFTVIRAFGYVRVSTDAQATDGNSLGVQRDLLRAICAAEGYELVQIFEDAGVSGGVPFAMPGAGGQPATCSEVRFPSLH